MKPKMRANKFSKYQITFIMHTYLNYQVKGVLINKMLCFIKLYKYSKVEIIFKLFLLKALMFFTHGYDLTVSDVVKVFYIFFF